MNVVQIVVTLIVIGVVLYIVQTIPMVPWIKNVINCVVALFVCLWLLQVFGISTGLPRLIR